MVKTSSFTDLHAEPLSVAKAREWILSVTGKKPHASSISYAVVSPNGELLFGVVTFGPPIGRYAATSVSPQANPEKVLQLTNLVLDPFIVSLLPSVTKAKVLGAVIQRLKEHTDIEVVMAYVDPTKETGEIYEELGGIYQGNSMKLRPSYIHKVKGEYLHPRTCWDLYGTVRADLLQEVDPNYYRIPLPKKHRYIFVLRDEDEICATLKHPALPYPNWDKLKVQVPQAI